MPGPHSKSSFKKGDANKIDRQRALRRVRGGSLGFSNTIEEVVGYTYNAVLTGLSFRYKAGIWTAIIKADFSSGPMVAFLDVGTFGRCVEVLEEYCRRGVLKWHHDKYPPRLR